MNIGDIFIDPPLALAPMAGVTDAAFRIICRESGAGLTYTEMVSAKALCYQDSKTRGLLAPAPGDRPVAAQIFGSDPVCMGEAAAKAAELSGADMIDINMGCPVGKVVRGGDGCALMREPELARAIIENVKNSVNIPVTVKIRKGWDKGSANAVDFALMAEAAGVSAVAVHGRTRAQLYSGVADWDIIAAVKSALKVPVIANGDVFTGEDAVRILKYTGADMVMIGRGSFGNPWLFAQAAAAIKGVDIPALPSLRVRMDTALRQFELSMEDKGEHIACLEARKYFSWYLKGVAHSGFFKDKISKFLSAAEVRSVTEAIKRELR